VLRRKNGGTNDTIEKEKHGLENKVEQKKYSLERKKTVERIFFTCLLLPPSQSIRRLSLVKSQRLLSMIEFILENMNIYNIKSIPIDSP
jgi:hypothetical protein